MFRVRIRRVCAHQVDYLSLAADDVCEHRCFGLCAQYGLCELRRCTARRTCALHIARLHNLCSSRARPPAHLYYCDYSDDDCTRRTGIASERVSVCVRVCDSHNRKTKQINKHINLVPGLPATTVANSSSSGHLNSIVFGSRTVHRERELYGPFTMYTRVCCIRLRIRVRLCITCCVFVCVYIGLNNTRVACANKYNRYNSR